MQLNHYFSVNHYFSFRIKQKLQIIYSCKFICFHIVSFYANITIIYIINITLITADLLNQNPTKKVMLLNTKIVLIGCCRWISFQSDEYNHY